MTDHTRQDATPRQYNSFQECRHHRELLSYVLNGLAALPPQARILDAGCGNGYFSGSLMERGFDVTGVDVSESGIAMCRREHPNGQFHIASVDSQKLREMVGDGFDAIVALEVIEHLYSPSAFLQNCHQLLAEDGVLVISTPYHGYLKNLLLALRSHGRTSSGADGGWTHQVLVKILYGETARDARVRCRTCPRCWPDPVPLEVNDHQSC